MTPAPKPLWFPNLATTDAPASRRAWRVTLSAAAALLLAALAVALALLPAVPPLPVCLTAAAALWGYLLLRLLLASAPGWRRLGLLHFAVRFFWAACAVWMFASLLAATVDVAEELDHYWWTPLLAGLFLLLPLDLLLREALRIRGGAASPAWHLLHLWTDAAVRLTLLFGLVFLVTGLFLELRRDYPGDPTVILLILWVAAFLAAVRLLDRTATRAALFRPAAKSPPRPLDDPPSSRPSPLSSPSSRHHPSDSW